MNGSVEVVLECTCIERSGVVNRKVRPTLITLDRVKFLWEKMKEFDVLFNDFTKGDLEAFLRHFITQDANGEFHSAGLMWDVDDVGMFILKEIKPYDSAEAHFIFWDQVFNGREELCRRMLKYAFGRFKFQRIYTLVGVHATSTLNAVERIGMVQEGRIRSAVLYEGKWFDANLYGVLPDDIADEHKPFKARLDSRFVCPDCGERLFKKEGVRHGPKNSVG